MTEQAILCVGLVGMWIGAIGGFFFAIILADGSRADERDKAGAEIHRLRRVIQEQDILRDHVLRAYDEALAAIDEHEVSDPRIEAFRALVRPGWMAS
jgi:hypothetical protein